METLISGIASFTFFHLISHPKSRISKKVPYARVKRVQFLPNLRIEVKNRVLHIHHWMLFAPIYLFAQAKGSGILQSDLLHGFLIGGILQGLMYKDSLKLIHSAAKPFEKQGYTVYPIRILKKIF